MVLMTLPSFAQKKDKDFNKLVKETNKLLDVLFSMSPLENCTLKEYGLSHTDERIRDYRGYPIATDTDVILQVNVMSFYRDRINENIQSILNYPSIIQYDLVGLLHHVQVAKSEDGRLYILKYYEDDGGSMAFFRTFIHYRSEHNGVVNHFPVYNIAESGDPNAPFEENGYDSIYTIKTTAGNKYLLFGVGQSCHTCVSNCFELVSYKDSNFVKEFNSFATSRAWNTTVTYDKKDTVIDVLFYSDDVNGGCICSDTFQDEKRRNHSCHYIYKFNGSTFELKKQEIEFLPPEKEEE